MAKTKGTVRLCVYGTLMYGQQQYHAYLGCDPTTKYVGEFHSLPELQLYEYQGDAVLTKGTTSVLLQVFDVTYETMEDIVIWFENDNIPNSLETITTPYGEAMVIMHAHSPVNNAYILDNGDWRDHAKRRKLNTTF